MDRRERSLSSALRVVPLLQVTLVGWHRGVTTHPFQQRLSIHLSPLGLSPAQLPSPSFTLRMKQSQTKHHNNKGTQRNCWEEEDASVCCARSIPGRIPTCQPPSERHPYPALGCGAIRSLQQPRDGGRMVAQQDAMCQRGPAEGCQSGPRSPLPASPAPSGP